MNTNSEEKTPLDIDPKYETLDLTKSEFYPIEEEPYDPRPQEDKARRRITYILLVLLSVIVIWALTIITFCPDSKENILDIVQILLSPIIALVSAATGFYFGANNK